MIFHCLYLKMSNTSTKVPKDARTIAEKVEINKFHWQICLFFAFLNLTVCEYGQNTV